MKGNFVSCQIITRAMAGLADALTDEHNGKKKIHTSLDEMTR